MARLSVKDTAARLGTSEDSILRRIKLNRLRAIQDNRGKWWVLLDDEEAEKAAEEVTANRAVRSDRGSPYGVRTAMESAETAAPGASGMVSLADVRAMMGEQQDRAERQHREALASVQEAHRAAMAMMIERVDAAEIRAERVEEKLDQVLDQLLDQHQPWWSRWLGSSRRSDIRGS